MTALIAVKLDENLGHSHAEILRQAGYSADRVTDQGLTGAADQDVWQHVVTADRFFITLDLDFADVRRFPPGSHPGLLLLRRAATAVKPSQKSSPACWPSIRWTLCAVAS